MAISYSKSNNTSCIKRQWTVDRYFPCLPHPNDTFSCFCLLLPCLVPHWALYMWRKGYILNFIPSPFSFFSFFFFILKQSFSQLCRLVLNSLCLQPKQALAQIRYCQDQWQFLLIEKLWQGIVSFICNTLSWAGQIPVCRSAWGQMNGFVTFGTNLSSVHHFLLLTFFLQKTHGHKHVWCLGHCLW